jgi:hypothetical protein
MEALIMAIAIAANSILRIVINSLLDQQLVENVFYITNHAASTLEAMENVVNNNMLNFYNDLSNEIACTSVSVQSLSPVHTDPYEEAKAFNGGDLFAALPVANAAIVSMKTGLGGRHNRGRKYLAGIPQQDVDNSRLTEDKRLEMQTTWNNMNNYFGADGIGEATWGIYHREGVAPNFNHVFVAVNSVIVRPILGTQRSRLPGHGR